MFGEAMYDRRFSAVCGSRYLRFCRLPQINPECTGGIGQNERHPARNTESGGSGIILLAPFRPIPASGRIRRCQKVPLSVAYYDAVTVHCCALTLANDDRYWLWTPLEEMSLLLTEERQTL